MTDPVNSGNRSLEQATASVRGESLPSGPSLLCLRSRSLSSPMGGGFFIPFVVALQQQSDPFAADPPAALAIAGRTLLLHVPRGAAAGGSEPDASACLLARELMALQLGQPGQRSQAFERIHNGLAATIAASAKAGHNAQSTQEFGLFLFSPLQMLLSKATSPKHANPLSAELQESPYWVVLNRQANAVAEAIDSFADLPEEALKKAWRSWDGDFAMAAQDRLEVVEQQQRAAQDGALKLLAEAGIDPRPCAALAQPPVDQARLSEAIATFERTRTNPLITQRALPRRFLPETNSVVIFPASARPTATPR